MLEDGKLAPSARGLYTPFQALKGYAGFSRNAKSPPDWVARMFVMFRVSAFARHGGFDPRYFMYCEDVDICLRLQLRGGQILYLDSVVSQRFSEEK